MSSPVATEQKPRVLDNLPLEEQRLRVEAILFEGTVAPKCLVVRRNPFDSSIMLATTTTRGGRRLRCQVYQQGPAGDFCH